MEATTERTQSLFPARFLFNTTDGQMKALDGLTDSIPGATRLTIARAALAIGLAYIEATGVVPLTAKAAQNAANDMVGSPDTYRIPESMLAERAPVAGVTTGRAQ